MRSTAIAFLLSSFMFSVFAQQTYFNHDYHFDLQQASGGTVFYNFTSYSTVSNIIDDVNIQGIKHKWKPVFTTYNLNGDTVNAKVYNNTHSLYIFKTIKTYTGNFISIGTALLDTVNYQGQADSTMVVLFKFNSSGDTIERKYLLYAPNKLTYGYDIYQEADSGFVICGLTNKYSTKFQAFVLRLDKDGNELWEKTYPNAGDVYAYSIAKSGDGGYLLGCTQWGGGHLGLMICI